MKNYLTDDTKVILLLCGVLGKDKTVKPLALNDYNKLVRWLRENEFRPADLLDPSNVIAAAIGSGLEQGRLQGLMARGVQLGFTIEEWQRNGVWLLSRGDRAYPRRLKKHLSDKSPALLFGVGEQSLLRGGGVGIVGSRDVDEAGRKFTQQVAEQCVRSDIPVVSGGARGVDQISMNTALDAGGVTIGVLAENLLKKSLERNARKAIADGQLLLISPYHPSARFSVGTAMGRNKLIYAMADYGLVVSADYKKGGTWAGAKEELKRKHHIPVFVRGGSDVPLGNTKLMDLGAEVWPKIIDTNKMCQILEKVGSSIKKEVRQSGELNLLYEFKDKSSLALEIAEDSSVLVIKEVVSSTNFSPAEELYQVVLPILLKHLGTPIIPDELAKILDVSKTQLNRWLKRAVESEKISKMNKPVRYCIVGK